METKGLGAGSYPSPQEYDEYKRFSFKANISLEGIGYVYAKTEEEAKSLIYLGSWEELETFKIEAVEEITDIKEEID